MDTEPYSFIYQGSEVSFALPGGQDHISNTLIERGNFYEVELLEALAGFLKPGDLVVDAGANIGNHTVYFSKVLGCRVAAFEAVPSTFAYLKRNVAINQVEALVTAHNVALGAKASQATIKHYDENNVGGTSLQLGAEGDIPVRPLDELMAGEDVRLIKIDVEGMDLDVLKGASAIIEERRPWLVCEAATAGAFEPVREELERHGYVAVACYNATDTFIFLPCRTVEERDATVRYGFGEIIALQKESRRLAGEIRRSDRYSERLMREVRSQLSATVASSEQGLKELMEKEMGSMKQSIEGDLDSHHTHAENRLNSSEAAARKLVADLDENWERRFESAVQSVGAELGRQLGVLQDLSARLVDREVQVGVLNERLAGTLRQVAEARAEVERARKKATKAASALTAAEGRGDFYKRHAEASSAALRELTGALQQLRDKSQAVQRENGELRAALTQAATHIEVQAERLSSISNQAGRAIAMGLRSPREMVRLPGRLLRLHHELRRRKEGSRPEEVVPVGGTEAIEFVANAKDLVQVDSQQMLDAVALPVASALADKAVPRLPSVPRDLAATRMAVIMDEFTYASYKDCCTVRQLSVKGWREQLESFQPDLLFIESAWRGLNEEWKGKVNHCCDELEGIIQWCRQHRIPTVFWNKEDPVHFEGFLATAKRFDYVFTTDIECISRYKAGLGHDRVYLLPFAFQPATHNPVEKYVRQDAFCFAGAYYARYPERQRDFDVFLDVLSEASQVEIYDRNHGKDDPQFIFPERYQHLIKGSLPFDQIDLAYKGYRYAINLNSVKQSQTMFARRAFDLLGSNTVTVSNYSPGLRLLFGDLVITTDSGDELLRRLQPLLDDEATYRRFRLMGLRKALSEHTYQHRLAYVLSKVYGTTVQVAAPDVVVVARVRSEDELQRVLSTYRAQSWARKALALVLDAPSLARRVPRSPDIAIFGPHDAAAIEPAKRWAGKRVAGLACDDYYGPHYLDDLALAARFSQATCLGKRCFHAANGDDLVLSDNGAQYQPSASLDLRSSMLDSEAIEGSLADFVDRIDAGVFVGDGFAIDEFGYVRNGAGREWPLVEDLPALHPGLPLVDVQARAEAIGQADFEVDPSFPRMDAARLGEMFGAQTAPDLAMTPGVDGLSIDSQMSYDRHQYFYAQPIPVDWWSRQELRLNLDVRPGVSIELAILFLDAEGKRVGTHVKAAGRNHAIEVPEGADTIRLGLRIKGGGTALVRALYMEHLPVRSGAIVAQAPHLILTNHYPSYTHLYRNGFVHRRVVGYRELGLRTEVFCLSRSHSSMQEFENVDVRTGDADQLRLMLATNRFETVQVHFLDEAMWSVLRDFADRVRVIVWVHGAEVQPWYRRDFNYTDDAQRQAAMEVSEQRMKFWRSVFGVQLPNVEFVFVSRYFAEEVMEDVGIRLPEDSYRIIHNFIDTGLFEYVEKDPAQRLKVLSIRPYASNKYANDLSVRAILALKDRPFFQDMEFRMIGDGPMFDDTLAPLAGLDNVVIERRFLRQHEIAQMHRDYGVFLCPTRMDSQGVSRDEAMSSGLVPVTTAVTAIPEFVDDTCGILAPGEGWQEMADGMERLVFDEDLFRMLSQNAAGRVRKQSGFAATIEQEVQLIMGTDG